MTDETPRAPEGWYPDPEDGRYLRWWTGHQWGLRTPVPDARASKPVGRGFARLAGAVGVLMALTMVVLVGEIGLHVWGFTMIEDAVAAGDVARLDRFDGLDQALGVLLGTGMVVTGISWMVWQYRLARAAAPGELRRGPKMHAFSWIIPIVAAWFPFQNVKDLWRVNVPDRGRAILGWWWTGWIVLLVLDRVIPQVYDSTDSVAEFRTLMVVQLVGAVVALGTAVLALRILKTLTTGGLDRDARAQVSVGGSPAAW